MRTLIEDRLRREGDSRSIVEFTTGEIPAGPIASTFFALCKELGDLQTDDEQAIWERLRNRVVFKAVPERNDFAHADWSPNALIIGPDAPDPAEGQLMFYWRAKIKDGEPIKPRPITIKELRKRSAALAALRPIVVEFGRLCLGLHPCGNDLRVRDVFTISGSKKHKEIQRDGPKAVATLQAGFSSKSSRSSSPSAISLSRSGSIS